MTTAKLTAILITALGIGLAGSAVLQAGPGYGPRAAGYCPAGFQPAYQAAHRMSGPMHGQGLHGPFWSKYSEQDLARLKSELAITPAQESAWNRFTDVIEAQTEAMEEHRETMHHAGPMGRQERREARYAQRPEIHTAITGARADLYAVLSDEQKAKADQILGFRCVRVSG